ncbi:MAG: MBL fold metallo-hydrolase [Bacteroidales bacterium]|nr:MBL fold metallo-hydrolase [Bacteroidales bacterium]
MLKIKQFAFNPFQVSSFVVYDPESLDAIVVDPGMTSSAEERKLDDFIEQNHLKVQQVVNTHMHLDHCFGDNYVRDKYGVKVAAHLDDADLGQNIGTQAAEFGIHLSGPADAVTIDVPLTEGDVIKVGNNDLQVLHVPGHSRGSIVLYSPEGHFAIVGDVLFQGSIGRTDLPGGNQQTLINGIRTKLLTLPDETLVLPGHGPMTTIGREKATNPYLN